MDKERDDIRREIEQKRDELSDQLAELALRLDTARDKARNAVRPRFWVERRPWLVVAGSVAAGYVVERSLSRVIARRRRAEIDITADDEISRQLGDAVAEQRSSLDAISSRLSALDTISRQVTALDERSGALERRFDQVIEARSSDGNGKWVDREPEREVESTVSMAGVPSRGGPPRYAEQPRKARGILDELAPFSELARGALVGIVRSLFAQIGKETTESAIHRRRWREPDPRRPSVTDERPPYSPYEHEERPWIR